MGLPLCTTGPQNKNEREKRKKERIEVGLSHWDETAVIFRPFVILFQAQT